MAPDQQLQRRSPASPRVSRFSRSSISYGKTTPFALETYRPRPHLALCPNRESACLAGDVVVVWPRLFLSHLFGIRGSKAVGTGCAQTYHTAHDIELAPAAKFGVEHADLALQ